MDPDGLGLWLQAMSGSRGAFSPQIKTNSVSPIPSYTPLSYNLPSLNHIRPHIPSESAYSNSNLFSSWLNCGLLVKGSKKEQEKLQFTYELCK